MTDPSISPVEIPAEPRAEAPHGETGETAGAPAPHALLEGVLTDLDVLSASLDALVTPLDEDGWRTPTPAAGWDVATQVAHLAWTDVAATAAATDKAAWDEIVLQALADMEGFVDTVALQGGAVDPPALLAQWRKARVDLAAALRAQAQERPGEKMPWFGPPMSPVSMASARYMETWAHGLDVADALGVELPPDDGVRHVVHIGVRTRNFAFATRELTPPAEEFHVKLLAPSGEVWTYGPEDAAQRVEGSAHDFARLVTQRRHRLDLDLVATGPDADRWLDVAQAFAGPPGPGRPPAAATTGSTTSPTTGPTEGGTA
ncbi:TIGR03084 family metal-binding protein [Nocardioides alkalitolerans]|uniref:TIGR03084 family metal-binding protein n=1 Tax=Nocardioides alkalitolerans TaxID=281714 RepID=UPI000427DA59|nr:TIGR03084 family metal-binding protein [Nocardioides alkalitolerans]